MVSSQGGYSDKGAKESIQIMSKDQVKMVEEKEGNELMVKELELKLESLEKLKNELELKVEKKSHYLAMDVHDCSKIGYDRTIKPDVVITIEPGIYIPSSLDCAQR
ncbi:intermediate cleaving peptidase 55, mitochondrial isoform X2 [Tanacetum coccineum]